MQEINCPFFTERSYFSSK
uniref:Uncharacterized protein n=1 Tax=Arundo donax TaxID=35708 RepID=A0A0A9B0Q0_ARUDO